MPEPMLEANEADLLHQLRLVASLKVSSHVSSLFVHGKMRGERIATLLMGWWKLPAFHKPK